MRKEVINSEVYKQKFIFKANKRHNNKFNYDNVIYTNSITKVEVMCIKHGSFFVRPDAHIRKVGCPNCNGGVPDTLESFIEKSNIKHNNKYSYENSNYINSTTKIKVNCYKHGIFEILPNNHIYGQGCSKCAGVKKKTTIDFINDANRVHDKLYDYSLTEYKMNRIKVKIICSKHGLFEQVPKDHLKGSGCPKCKLSKGEKLISKILNDNNIEYMDQYTFDDCRNINVLLFDFYLPEYNTCIEFDGRQHFEVVEAFGGEDALIKVKINDDIKTQYCLNNFIKLIRVKYNDVDSGINEIISIIKK